MTDVRVFGIRHHGPGSARSVCTALAEFAPDAVLLEGPPEADALIAAVADAGLQPPVALLVYAADAPQRCAFYPFAEYSPEWQALRYAVERGLPVRWIDLPHACMPPRAAVRSDADDAADQDPNDDAHAAAAGEPPVARRDPWQRLAEVAGVDDPEALWERWIEERPDGLERFAAVAELMAELRHDVGVEPRDLLREAHMRRELRAEIKAGRERIAIVCGAWHAPALIDLPTAKSDQDLLRGLPKTKMEATWVPWSHGRLALASGYGAGIEAPGWYAHLWRHGAHDPARWVVRAATILREHDLDYGPAHAIEAQRLAQTLAVLRGRLHPGLAELDEAIRTTFCSGDDAPLRLIADALYVGDALGTVPANTPEPPLCSDLRREQKRLRLPPEASARAKELDLRNDTDRARSQLLHRLRLLGVQWGEVERERAGTGTFRETWTLRWDPELVLPLIDAARYGNRIEDAAIACVRERAAACERLADVAALLEHALKAGLDAVHGDLAARLDALAAHSGDVAELMEAFSRLAPLARYGDVRGTDTAALRIALDHYCERICVGLLAACSAINDDVAPGLLARISNVDQCLRRTDPGHWTPDWLAALARLADGAAVHPLLAGRAVRLQLDRDAITADEAARRLGLALSPGVAVQQAAWLEGLLGDSGLLLVHQQALLGLIDAWLTALPGAVFDDVLPLLRRSFARFAQPERRQIGERIKAGGVDAVQVHVAASDIDWTRARALLPLFERIWGVDA